jgi:putative aldouronate transport system permease protein
MLLPIAYFIIFRYLPIWNGQIAFRDFKPLLGIPEYDVERGVFNSAWIGLTHFRTFINSFYFVELIRNTLFYSFGKLLVSVPAAILFAVMLFECSKPRLARVVQTLAYLPHFLSWVIMYGILFTLLSPGDGVLNDFIKFLGQFGIGRGEPIDFLRNTDTFPWIIILSDAWKEMGWSAIIFIAALISIDPTLFEAAMVEGATATQRVWYITLPSIRPVIVIVVLLRLGTILDAGFHQMFMLYSPAVYSVADIIDTWVYRQGLLNFQYGLATAVGLFKGFIGMLLIITSNWLVKRISDSSLF